MKTISKKILKTNYYYEFKSFYDDLPDELPIPGYIEKANTTWTTEENMVKGNNPFSKEEAFGLICKFIQDKKEGYNLVWFKDDKGALCKVDVYLDDDGWCVTVPGFAPSDSWPAGDVSFFSNKNLDTLSNDSLTLENAINICKEAGLKITRTKVVEEEL